MEKTHVQNSLTRDMKIASLSKDILIDICSYLQWRILWLWGIGSVHNYNISHAYLSILTSPFRHSACGKESQTKYLKWLLTLPFFSSLNMLLTFHTTKKKKGWKWTAIYLQRHSPAAGIAVAVLSNTSLFLLCGSHGESKIIWLNGRCITFQFTIIIRYIIYRLFLNMLLCLYLKYSLVTT